MIESRFNTYFLEEQTPRDALNQLREQGVVEGRLSLKVNGKRENFIPFYANKLFSLFK